jgi:hypothetical protein
MVWPQQLRKTARKASRQRGQPQDLLTQRIVERRRPDCCGQRGSGNRFQHNSARAGRFLLPHLYEDVRPTRSGRQRQESPVRRRTLIEQADLPAPQETAIDVGENVRRDRHETVQSRKP